MAIILKCEFCDKPMRLLDEHKVFEDKYSCLKCFTEKTEEKKTSEDTVKEFYENLGDDIPLGWLGLEIPKQWTQDQFDALNKIWNNLQKYSVKNWVVTTIAPILKDELLCMII